MPATRSRTENWKQSLEQVAVRGGALDIALKRDDQPGDAEPGDLLWRCKILAVKDREIVVQSPAAMGQAMTFREGVELVASLSIGQNRWLFPTRVLSARKLQIAGTPHQESALVLSLPDNVERCARRSHLRVATASLNLATVQCWPLLDPTSVVAAETANRTLMNEHLDQPTSPSGAAPDPVTPESILLPSVGPSFQAKLMNLSGGGLGLQVSAEHSSACDRQAYLWLRVNLTPTLPIPLALTARRVHSHLDSGQNVYLGLSFDFTHHPEHKDFVSSLLAKYVDRMMQRQAIRVASGQ